MILKECPTCGLSHFDTGNCKRKPDYYRLKQQQRISEKLPGMSGVEARDYALKSLIDAGELGMIVVQRQGKRYRRYIIVDEEG